MYVCIRYVTLHFRDRCGASSLCYINRAKITVFMCVQKPYPVWFLCRRKSNLVLCEHNLSLWMKSLSAIACEKSRRLATPPLVFPPNDV